jgi:1-phosphatidylinositol-4-phosphate 5-kinase
VEELQKANSEVREELEAVKAVVEVYDKHRPQAADKKTDAGESSSEEDFEDDVESFDKTSARDDAHLSRPTKAKNGTDKYSMDLMSSSAIGSGGGRPKKPSLEQEALMHISSKPRHTRLSSDSTLQGNTLTSSSNSIRPDDSDPHLAQRGNQAAISPPSGRARPTPSQRRPDVPKANNSGPISRKFHTARDIGISLSKEDERELFGLGDRFAAATRDTTASSSGSRTPRMSGEAPSARYTITPSSSNNTVPSQTAAPSAAVNPPKRSKSKPEESVVEEEPVHRDQPKIFDENTVRDILCGLSITMSRNFNDDLLVPADYSYSYQFKVRRVPQQLLKFKDFAPKVFQQIRQHWGIDNSELLMSFGYDNLDAIRGEGKSGAFFIFTRDKRFILKTATGPERDFLWEMLPYYFLYIRKNPNTLLPRFYGVYSMKHEGIGGMVRFVVMNNVFATPSPLNEIYDLKGSTLGRSSGDDVPKGSILKDLDIKRKLYMADDGLKKLYLDQLYLDSQFLAQHNVMDYSLLVGIHYDDEEGRLATQKKQAEWSRLYTEDASYRSIFQTDGNGIAGWNTEANRREVYFIGIIDILQKYTPKKKIEHFLKSIPYKAATVSVVEPSYYAKRFHNFLSGVTGTSPKVVSMAPARLAAESEPDFLPDVSEESDEQSNSFVFSASSPSSRHEDANASEKEKPSKSSKKGDKTTSSPPEADKAPKKKKKRSTRTSDPSEEPDAASPSSEPIHDVDQSKAVDDSTGPSKRKKKSKQVEEAPPDEISESSEEVVVKPKRKHKSTKTRQAE